MGPRPKGRGLFCARQGARGSRGFTPWGLCFAALRVVRGLRGFAPVPCGFGVCKTFGFCILFWQCLLKGRLGPPFFPAGKESAAGGVKKGGQGGFRWPP